MTPVHKKFEQLTRMFEPERTAVIGVSSEGFSFGRAILMSLINIGYRGTLYPVNPKGGTIAGLSIYRDVRDIPGSIDFGIITIPAPAVPEAVIACKEKGAAGVEVLSAGFRETDTPEGIELEERLARIASSGIRIVGPNCFGIYNPRSGLTLLPGPDLSRMPGPVAFISQSGGMTIDFAHVGKWRGISFSTMVSFGNGVDLRETELLEYFTADTQTGVIGMYIEGIKDGRRFYQALKSACEAKPVIICKGGMSEYGQRAAMSHTASISGSSEIWRAIFTQCNAVQARSLDECADYALAFTSLPLRRYHGVSIIGGGGAIGVMAADIAAEGGLAIPQFEPSLQAEILAILPRPGSSAKNPVDVANPYVAPDVLEKIITAAGKCRDIDIQIVVQLLYHYKALAIQLGAPSIRDIVPLEQFAESFSRASATTGKPVLVVLPDYKQEAEAMDIAETIRMARAYYAGKGIPVFDDVGRAIRAVQAVSRYATRRFNRTPSVT